MDYTDEDTTITALLDAAVSHVSDYCNRHFTALDTAIFYLERWRPAALAFGPVTGITSVVYDDTTGTQQTLDASKYYFSQFREGHGASTSMTSPTLRTTMPNPYASTYK